MADNVSVTPGSGKIIKTEDIGGAQYQEIKINFGGAGVATRVSSSDPFPVTVSTALPAGSNAIGTLAANSGVDIGDVTINNTSGNPVVIGDGGSSITVDGSVSIGSALPAGSNAIGGVTQSGSWSVSLASSLPSGSNAIGTVTVDSGATADYDTGAGTDTVSMMGIALPANGGAVAGGTSSNPIRFDPTGTTTQPVSDGGGSLTIDGSVDIGSALPAGTNNIGDVDIASITAGDNTIGRIKITDGTTVASVRDLASNDALNVAIVDGSGSQITSFGGGTQYTEGDTDASITGTALLWEDSADTLRAVSTSKPLPTVQTGALPAGTNNIGDVDVASITAGDNLIGRVKLSDGTTVATVRELGTNDALNVAIVDGSGNQITSFGGGGGGGTQYTEGDTDASITGTAMLWEDDSTDTLMTANLTNPLPVQLPQINGVNPLAVFTHGSKTVSASITRPNDTTPYTTGDAWTDSTSSPTASLTQISGMVNSSGGWGVILNALLVDSANQVTKGNFEVFLFTEDITLDNDNSAFTPTDGEMETCIGVISFVGTLARSGNSTSGATGNCIYTPFGFTPITYKADSTTIYYAIKVANGYTPVAQEKLTLVLNIQKEY